MPGFGNNFPTQPLGGGGSGNATSINGVPIPPLSPTGAVLTVGPGPSLTWQLPTPTAPMLYSCPLGVSVGDAVYVSGSSAVDRALANDPATMPAIGLVVSKDASGTIATVQDIEEFPLAGFAAGRPLYVSDTTPGALTATAPSAPGSVEQSVAEAKSATTILLRIGPPIQH